MRFTHGRRNFENFLKSFFILNLILDSIEGTDGLRVLCDSREQL